MQFSIIALTAALSTLTAAAPQIDFGCTLSCGVWNACRVRAVAEGNPLSDCGPEPDKCNCQQFADFKRDAEAVSAPVEVRAPEPQIDFGCTLSCGVWNACRVRAVAEGNPLSDCGAEPDKCNCQQFADFKREAAAPAPTPVSEKREPQIDFGCTLSCGVWNACRVRALAEGEPLSQCGAEPDKCNCQQFADFKREAPAPVSEKREPQIDFGCTLSCGVWNACRVRALAEGEPLSQCGAEPDKCNCQQFADFKREAPAPVKRAPEPQIDFGCTLSCGVWNACRVRALAEGEPLSQCGAEPNKCNCQQFADFKA